MAVGPAALLKCSVDDVIVLLERSVGDVVEVASARKGAERAVFTDFIGVDNDSSPDTTQSDNPNISTNFEPANAGNSELGTVVGLAIV